MKKLNRHEIAQLSPTELKDFKGKVKQRAEKWIERREYLLERMRKLVPVREDNRDELAAIGKELSEQDREDDEIGGQWEELIKAVDSWATRWESPDSVNDLIKQ